MSLAGTISNQPLKSSPTFKVVEATSLGPTPITCEDSKTPTSLIKNCNISDPSISVNMTMDLKIGLMSRGTCLVPWKPCTTPRHRNVQTKCAHACMLPTNQHKD